jgi:hypothetical protein
LHSVQASVILSRTPVAMSVSQSKEAHAETSLGLREVGSVAATLIRRRGRLSLPRPLRPGSSWLREAEPDLERE